MAVKRGETYTFSAKYYIVDEVSYHVRGLPMLSLYNNKEGRLIHRNTERIPRVNEWIEVSMTYTFKNDEVVDAKVYGGSAKGDVTLIKDIKLEKSPYQSK